MLPSSRRALVDSPQLQRWCITARAPCTIQLSRTRDSRVCLQAAEVAQPALFADSSLAPEPPRLQLPAAVTAAVAAVTASIDELGTNHQQQQRGRQRQRLFGSNGSSSGSSSNGAGGHQHHQQQQLQDDDEDDAVTVLSEQMRDRIASNLSASSSYDFSDADAAAITQTASASSSSSSSSGRVRRARFNSSSTTVPQQQQQQQQQQQWGHANAPRSQRTVSWYREQANRRLTWHITHAPDITTLRQLMRQYEGSLNHIHVNALFGRLVKLVQGGQLRPLDMLSLNSFIPQVLQLVTSALPDYNERCISNTLHGLAALELYQERELFASLITAAERISISTFTPQGLANTAWALATLRLNPGPRLSHSLLTASNKIMTQFKPQELAQLGWAFGSLRTKVSEEWARSWRAAVLNQLECDGFSAQGISMILWGAAHMWEKQQVLQPAAQFVPQQQQHNSSSSSSSTGADSTAAEHAEWLQAVEASIQAHSQQHTPQSISICLWGLARLGYKPSQEFVSNMLATAKRQLCTNASPKDLTVLLYSLAAVGYLPSNRWLKTHGAALRHLYRQLTVRQVSNLLWAHGRLGVKPRDKDLLDKLMEQLYYGMQGANARDLANSLWGLAAIGAQPEKRWISIFSAQAEALIHNFSPQEVANLLWAYATLGHKPPHMLLVALWEGVGIGSLGSSSGSLTGSVTGGITTARLSAFKPQELSMLVWALAKLRAIPGKEWWEQFLQASYHKMPQQSPQGLSNIIWALSELELQPPPAWLYNWAAAARGVLGQMNPVDLGQIAAALQSPVLEPLQLPKLESLLLDVLDLLATVELQSGAYSRAAVELLMRIPSVDQGLGVGSSSSNSNGRALLRHIVEQQQQQQQQQQVAAEHLAAAVNGTQVGSSSLQHTAVDRDVQQLKQLLTQHSLAPPPTWPSASV